MLRDVRRLEVPELDVFHELIDVRTPGLRVGIQSGRNVASDYALLQRAAPFVDHLKRPQLVVLIDGYARLDERGTRLWYEPGTLMLSDASRGGLDAFGGATSRWLVLDWDPAVMGAPFTGEPRATVLSPGDVARLSRAADGLSGARAAEAVTCILSIVRANGFDFAAISPGDLEREADHGDARIHAAVVRQLSNLQSRPAIVDLAADLGAGERRLHRHIAAIAARYRLPWAHWRAALHHTRLLQAIRLLAAPGATTEIVARVAGFRAPSALCHAFDKGGLPSPGALARAARQGALDAWGSSRV